jgi:hypothetical protein
MTPENAVYINKKYRAAACWNVRVMASSLFRDKAQVIRNDERYHAV